MSATKRKILIVEDNNELAKMYKLSFESKGHQVEIGIDGQRAKLFVDCYHPDIILLDIMMPNVNGYEFLQQIRAEGNTTKIIVMSNLSQQSDIDKSIEYGADDYWIKADMNPFEVVDRVEKILAQA